MTTIYLVSEGEYSSYSINGVYSTRDLAEKAIEIGVGDDIEEYTLDCGEKQIRDGLMPHYGVMEKDGTSDIHQSSQFEGFTARMELQWAEAYQWRGANNEARTILRVWVYAESEQHAAKIANEHRAQLIASGEWDIFTEERVRGKLS